MNKNTNFVPFNFELFIEYWEKSSLNTCSGKSITVRRRLKFRWEANMHESCKDSLEIFLAAIISFHHWWWKYDNCIPLLMATLWAAISCWVCSCSNYVLSCWLNRQIKLDEQKAIHHGFNLREKRSSTGLILWSKFFIPHWTRYQPSKITKKIINISPSFVLILTLGQINSLNSENVPQYF